MDCIGESTHDESGPLSNDGRSMTQRQPARGCVDTIALMSRRPSRAASCGRKAVMQSQVHPRPELILRGRVDVYTFERSSKQFIRISLCTIIYNVKYEKEELLPPLARRCVRSIPSEDEYRLIQDLRTNYDPIERPVRNHSEAIRVNLRILLQQLVDVFFRNCPITPYLSQSAKIRVD
ncbi:hypothetical protein TELCIR_16685 [Teladorsagia circumcincta]|uniref:Uncharacterized protein n=1 Tax=Teladorsagia circumcincta TaxID=45464 RepID=A0A2G9TV36_TELCI|nr:hypothetical protein TELCIR_16685 [Teladorsagia circumcincta]